MASIFLGKPWHWGLLVASYVALGLVGVRYLHTHAFNLFTAICLGIGLAVVAAVVFTHRPGDRVTREPIEMPEE